jgi:hypothetical protein
MIYRIHLTAGNGLPVSETRKRADAAALLAETLVRNVVRFNAGLDTAQGNAAILAVRAIDPTRGGTATFYGRMLTITPSRS